MYTVDLYLRVRLACHVDGLSQREAASRFGIAREGSVAKSGYLVTCLCDLPRGVEA